MPTQQNMLCLIESVGRTKTLHLSTRVCIVVSPHTSHHGDPQAKHAMQYTCIHLMTS